MVELPAGLVLMGTDEVLPDPVVEVVEDVTPVLMEVVVVEGVLEGVLELVVVVVVDDEELVTGGLPQSPSRAVTPLGPLPKATRLVPQSALCANQTFLLSWSKTMYAPRRTVGPRRKELSVFSHSR